MKKLSEVNIEDAKKILNNAYGLFFRTGRWELTDESKSIGEPCKKLSCARKSYVFWFFDDCIDIDLQDENMPISFDDCNYDVKLSCYVKAAELGYYIPLLSKLLDKYWQEGAAEAQNDAAAEIRENYIPNH